ncbi:MAG TPA: hypothetical protein VGM03_03680 [Phycisphaerae bacterium]|jgi:hypothetical protein
MKIVSVLLVLALCVVGFGFYRGWFALSGPNRDTQTNKININLAVDPDQMKQDAAQVKDKTR